MKKSLLTAVAVVGVASVAWLAWPHLLSQDVAGHDGGDLSTVGSLTGKAGQESNVTGAPSSASQQAGRKQLPNPAEGTGSDTMVLKGRCVSRLTGRPLAGCKVRLHGWVRNNESLEEYVIKHGDVKWEETWRQVSGQDGRFEFRFVPLPPYQFTLGIVKEGLVRRGVRWRDLQAGTTKDLGDIDLGPGAVVSGRILDPKGRPLARKGLSFRLTDWRKRLGEMRETRSAYFRSDRNGAFSTTRPIEFGTWRSALQNRYGNDDRYSVEPAEFTIAPGQAHFRIDFVFREPPPAKDYISGQIVDESGLPVRGLTVSGVNPYGLFCIGETESGKDGRFRVDRGRDQSTDPVPLGVGGKGFETLVTKKKYSWGTEKIKLVVRRGVRVDVLVKDGETGEPVTDFGIRCFRAADAKGSGFPNPDRSLKMLGSHPGGRLFLEGIRRGKTLLLVEPRGGGYLPSGFHRFTATDHGAATQVISLYRSVERPLKVVRSDGSAVAGSRVELLATMTPGPADLETRIVKRSHLQNYGGGRNLALLICSGHTNSDGELLLTGRPREKFALRLLGPGHQAIVLHGVVVDPKLGTLRVEVPSGATLVGRISPPKLLQQFCLPLKTLQKLGNAAQECRPHIRLSRAGGRLNWFPTDLQERSIIGDDGRFELAGIPSGDWDLYLRFYVQTGERSRQSARELLLTVRGLEEGKKRELNIDIGHLAVGKLSGRIFVNGEPLSEAGFSLYGSKPDGKGGTRNSTSLQVQKTDRSGSFSVQIFPASYHLWVFLPKKHLGRLTTVPSHVPVVIGAGQVVHRVFQLHYRSLRLRVLASDGKTPVKGVKVEFHMPATHDWWGRMPTTDAAGSTARKGMPCSPLEFRIWPKHLSSISAQVRLQRQDRTAWKSARIVLGTLRLPPGEGEFRHQLVLPASSGY